VNFSTQHLPAVERTLVTNDRCGGDVHRAGAHGVVDHRDIAGHRRRHHQNRAGRGAHDLPGCLNPVQLRHDEIHQHDVGQRRGTTGNRFVSVAGEP